MSHRRLPSSSEKRNPRPLDERRLEELALAYVARFSTTAAKLQGYLARKLRERGWDGDRPADPEALVAKIVRLGYVDDAAYARARAGGLLRRGYGPRRVGEALSAAGVAEDLRAEAAPGDGAARQAALVLARKRRFGPFGTDGPPADRAVRQKQIAALLRAGHSFDAAKALIDAPSPQAAEEWATEAQEPDT